MPGRDQTLVLFGSYGHRRQVASLVIRILADFLPGPFLGLEDLARSPLKLGISQNPSFSVSKVVLNFIDHNFFNE